MKRLSIRAHPRRSRKQRRPQRSTAIQPVTDPAAAATEAGLRYVSPRAPGIERLRSGKGFVYVDAARKRVRAPQVLARIRTLVIPPAWNDVWICADPDGHLQAVGRDARRRKQYRYHPRWREVRDETKYGRMVAFGQALTQIRERTECDLGLEGLVRDKVLATVVRLLDTSYIRVGNEEYAAENGSFGLTTMRVKHAAVNGTTIHFKFPGKSKVHHAVDVTDRRLARIVKQCQHLPGQELFEYVDANGRVSAVTSADVNDYLREISGADFTAKDFRTWAGTVLAATELLKLPPPRSQTDAKRKLVQAVDAVAKRLGNTRAVCRKCYVHPALIDGFAGGTLAAALRRAPRRRGSALRRLKPEEATLLAFLIAWAKHEAGRQRAAS